MNEREEPARAGSTVNNIARGWSPDRIRALIATWDAQTVRGHKAGEALWVRWARPDVPDDVRRELGDVRTAEVVGAADFARVGRIRRSGRIVWDDGCDARLDEHIQRELNAGATSGRVDLSRFASAGVVEHPDGLVVWWARCGTEFGPELVDPKPEPGAVVGSLMGRPMVVSDDPALKGGPDKFGPTIDTSGWSDASKRIANLAAAREIHRRAEMDEFEAELPPLPEGWAFLPGAVVCNLNPLYSVTATHTTTKSSAVGTGRTLDAAVEEMRKNVERVRKTQQFTPGTVYIAGGKAPLDPLPELTRAAYWAHARTGTKYRVLAVAREEKTLAPVVVYGNDEGFWTRPFEEFTDGRFIPIDPLPPIPPK